MNENLFTFPGGTADASGDNPFDLSGFTELTGNNTQNPFADLLAGGEATEQPPAEGAGAVQADDSIPEEKDETDQNHETVEEDESHEISKSPAPQDPQPKSPPAPKSEEDHASDKPEEAEDNPRLAAMERQEEKTAPKVAEPIFAQLPVFSYNGSEAPIEDTEQTFDELRLSKLTDFPEFDEAQSLSWKVVYGKIVKEIENQNRPNQARDRNLQGIYQRFEEGNRQAPQVPGQTLNQYAEKGRCQCIYYDWCVWHSALRW